MRNVKRIAAVAVATCGILLAGVGGASAAPQSGGASAAPQSGGASAAPQSDGDNIPTLSNFNQLDWDNSPFCGFQIKTTDTEQETSCPVVHLENSPNGKVFIVTS